MERDQKKVKIDCIISKKKDARKLLKSCFKNSFFSLVPFEIWRDLIVSNADAKSIVLLSQTCYAFKEIVENIGESNFNLALLLRREGQIVLAKKYLLKCAENNNANAMFHLGFCHRVSGWGLAQDGVKAVEWFKKSAELGNTHAMAFYAQFLMYVCEIGKEDQADVWVQKVKSSNDSFAIGFYYHSVVLDIVKGFHFFEKSAKDGDEFGQYYLAKCFYSGHRVGKDFEKAFHWYLKSAEQGLMDSQFQIARLYGIGKGCLQNKELSGFWWRKSRLQSFNYERKELILD